MNLIIAAVLTGAGGAFTPCTLGVNLAMIHLFAKDNITQKIELILTGETSLEDVEQELLVIGYVTERLG